MIMLVGLCVSQAACAESPFSFRDVKATRLALSENGKPVFVYNYGMILAPGFPEKMRRSSYLHPVYAPDGTRLTDDFNPDHPHHRDLLDVAGGHRGRQTGPNLGAGRVSAAVCSLEGPPSRRRPRRLAVENGWYDGDRRFVKEDVEIITHRAAHQQRTLDFTLRFEAVDRPVQIVGTSQGKKGLGGFCFRFAPRDGGSGKTVIRTEKGISKKDDSERPIDGLRSPGPFTDSRPAGGLTTIRPTPDIRTTAG